MMGVNSLPKTVNQQRRDCDLNPGPSVPESSMLTTQLPSHPKIYYYYYYYYYFIFLAHQHKACRQLKIKQEMTAVGD